MEEVDAHDDPERYEERFVIGVETEAGDEVADAEQYDAIAELGRDVGVEVELRQLHPEHREERSHDDDEEGVEELRLPGSHLEDAEDVAVHVAVGKQGERGARLFEERPEEDVEEAEDDEDDHPVAQDAAAADSLAHEGISHVEEGEDEQDAHNTVVDDEEVEQRDGQEGEQYGELQLREWPEHF